MDLSDAEHEVLKNLWDELVHDDPHLAHHLDRNPEPARRSLTRWILGLWLAGTSLTLLGIINYALVPAILGLLLLCAGSMIYRS